MTAEGTVGEAVFRLVSKPVARSGKLADESTIGHLSADADDDWLI